jgi:mono/diheme cytochrome c family protein
MRTEARTLLLGLAAAFGCRSGAGAGEVELGRALYAGERPLAAHVAGQDFVLPEEAARCAGCHAGDAAEAPARPFAPTLTRPTLTEARARRGGPPSTYDADRLCRALRDGIDPTLVVIPQAMPRYALTDRQCRALWAYLSTRS